MKNIPFYSNHSDGMYCVLAVYRSLYDYFFDEKLSWDELVKKSKALKKKGVWHLLLDVDLANRGIDVVNIETIDYEKLSEGKVDYLSEIYDKQTVDYYLQETNIAKIFEAIPNYLKSVKHITRQPTIDDIDDLLEKGYLIGAEINPRILEDKPGFILHYVLIHTKDKNSYVLHDPGGKLPGIENYKVQKERLKVALANEVTGFKFSKNN